MFESTLPIPSVCRQLPLLASQILTVLSSDADASRAESCEKVTDKTEPRWPSSVCRQALLLSSQAGFIVMYSGYSDRTGVGEGESVEIGGRRLIRVNRQA